TAAEALEIQLESEWSRRRPESRAARLPCQRRALWPMVAPDKTATRFGRPLMSTSDAALGSMPEWDLRDLYPGTDSAELKRDLAWAAEEAARIRATYQGKLAALGGDGAALAEAIKAYEKLADVIGRIASYSGLLYYADTSDADRAKF